MNMDLANAMRAATQLTRAQKLMEATRLLQSALSGREVVPSAPPRAQAAKGRAIESRVIDLTPDVAARDLTVPFHEKLDAIRRIATATADQRVDGGAAARGVRRDTPSGQAWEFQS
jgi:hypothetical protein